MVNDRHLLDTVHADVEQIDLFVEVEQKTDCTTSNLWLAVRDAVVDSWLFVVWLGNVTSQREHAEETEPVAYSVDTPWDWVEL